MNENINNIIITGGCGFIGSHMVEHFIKNTNDNIIVIDKLSYSSNGFERLRDTGLIDNKRVKIFTCDLVNEISDGLMKEFGDVNYIIHLAAESDVNKSIKNPVPFVLNNIHSTLNILEYARKCKNLKRFIYFSTDECYGPCYKGQADFTENDKHHSTNPYSASKSGGEQLSIAYENTYKLPIITVNVMNVIGERQYVEKFIPKCIKYILSGDTIDIHCDKNFISGSRGYIHGRNVSAAILFLLKNGTVGELYHITGETEVTNLEMAQFISSVIGIDLKYKMVDSVIDRPGHDLRYALDGTKLFNLGFKQPVNFFDSLRKTIEWTLKNTKWLKE